MGHHLRQWRMHLAFWFCAAEQSDARKKLCKTHQSPPEISGWDHQEIAYSDQLLSCFFGTPRDVVKLNLNQFFLITAFRLRHQLWLLMPAVDVMQLPTSLHAGTRKAKALSF